jgi:menaquinone-specific isochorismate synthase
VTRPDLLLERFAADACVLWAPPTGLAFAGIGTAKVVERAGPERFNEVRKAGSELLSRVRSNHAPLPALSAPRLFGGFAFSPRGATSSIWEGFGPARFVLPRISYAVDGRRAVLTLAVERRELEQPSPHLELFEQVYDALYAPLAPEPSREAVSVGRWEPDEGDFRRSVDRLLSLIAEGRLDKAVLARQIELSLSPPAHAPATVVALRDQAPECVRFLFRSGAGCFVGATPERLVHKRGKHLETEALAGTIDAGAESPENRLQGSPKELEEHRLVVQAIAGALAPLSVETRVPSQPVIRRLKHLLHLSTPIGALLRDDTHAVDLLCALHTTPAVGGAPTDRALEWIEQNEAFDRGWYSGAVGWFDARGDGDFDVALRSGLLRDNRAWLYAGAGSVQDSASAAEYQETTLKLAALLGSLRSRS